MDGGIDTGDDAPAQSKANANASGGTVKGAGANGKKGGTTANGTGAGGEGNGTANGKQGGSGGGVGGGKGAGHEGGGNKDSNFGWYHTMLKDKFTSRWDQPLSLVQSGQNYKTIITIKIARSGQIVEANVTESSGNATMDESVLTAAKRVLQVEPLPKGLGEADGYEVPIAFNLSLP